MIETNYKDIFINGQDVYKKLKDGTYKKLCKWIDNVGYYQVCFRIDGKKKYVRVHRLIAETLLPNKDNLSMVNHKDGNKLNNSLDNLEWCTNAYNTKDAYDKGLYKSTYRCRIQAIHKESGAIQKFDSIRSCSKELGINRKTLTNILKCQKKTNNYEYEFKYI